ncbi:hypothetical protein ECPA14_2169, partial [Escherichia coli PA14]
INDKKQKHTNNSLTLHIYFVIIYILVMICYLREGYIRFL